MKLVQDLQNGSVLAPVPVEAPAPATKESLRKNIEGIIASQWTEENRANGFADIADVKAIIDNIEST